MESLTHFRLISVTIATFNNPGSQLERLWLGEPAISCEAAARAKGVDLEHELKSLLLTTSRGPVLAHIRGTHQLSLRAVKKTLAADQAQLASLPELEDAGLARGAVHPFAPSLWELPQLVARDVLQLDWVTTNAGEASNYVIFDPRLLLSVPVVSVCDLER
jgi:prolyl-tRNA editing enzyme YbaK/EbsC (Cys-tRNA(Pro) deacylase)